MKRKIELLAPGGDITAMKTAIYAGADAIYCGLNKFNARNRATNISFEDLQGILRIAHQHDCAVFLTLNIVILESEIPALIKLLNRLVNTSIDGVIVQDLGLMHILNKHFPTLEIHASTQLNTHNEGQIQFLKSLNAKRVNLSRELSIEEIKDLSDVAHQHEMGIEVFVHGSYCISFSGQCYMSSLQSGNSGNRGQCSQPCRDKFNETKVGSHYPLNLKDNSAFHNFEELVNAGANSLKIEGRIKEFEYVYTVVNAWRQQIDRYTKGISLSQDDSDLYKVFNRDFSNGFLKREIGKSMFIDNPMNHSITYLGKQNKGISAQELKTIEDNQLVEKKNLRASVTQNIENYDLSKPILDLAVEAKVGQPLCITASLSSSSFEVQSSSPIANKGIEALTESIIHKRLRAIDETEYKLNRITYNIDGDAYLPFKELTRIKLDLLYILNGKKTFKSPVNLPKLGKHKRIENTPQLSVIISNTKELIGLENYSGDIFYKLPNRLSDVNEYCELFNTNKRLIPYFPAILIGKDYHNAKELLSNINVEKIVTDNTGIAYIAKEKGIAWVAGPHMNITNSYSLQVLKEQFDCSGAFLSNELSKTQLLGIKNPSDFSLYYSIYHPIVLMTSRQCLSMQVEGCHKNTMDNKCISHCEKRTNITNAKGERFNIKKEKNNYHKIFHSQHLLNTEIANDIGDRFKSLTIDLSDIEDKDIIIHLFQNLLVRKKEAEQALKTFLSSTTNISYGEGV